MSLYGAGENESLILVDYDARQIIQKNNINSENSTISIIVPNNTNMTGFAKPIFIFLDTRHSNDLYVSDYLRGFVIVFSSMQTMDPLPRKVAGINQTIGAGLHEIRNGMGIAIDRLQNLYVADFGNHRVMRWAPNATSGVVIVGVGSPSSSSMGLNWPAGIFLDENHSLLYVADYGNNRIQVYNLNATPPYNGITVAGGNGEGSGSYQLRSPFHVWVSKKTRAIYIADLFNNRIQRWSPGASSGVTVAGNLLGQSGSSRTMLNAPNSIVINNDETRLYVSDRHNRRVQRFDLI